MEIRRALAEDLPRIRDIYNQAVLERSATCDEEEKSLEDRQAWFEQFNEAYPIFVLISDDKVAGYGCLLRYSPKSGYRYAVENSIYIDRCFRGRGFGKQMLSHLLETATQLGYKYIEARIFQHNKISLDMHAAQGFTLVGIQKDIANLDGKWYSNTILSRRL